MANKPFSLRQVNNSNRLHKRQAGSFSLYSPHLKQLLEFRFFPISQIPQPLGDAHDDAVPIELHGPDWFVRFSHFQHVSEAWFGVSLSQYHGALRQWMFDLIPVCLGEDFALEGLSTRPADQNTPSDTGGDMYLLQCMAEETLLAQSSIEVNVSTTAAASMLMSTLSSSSVASQPLAGFREPDLLPARIAPLVLNLDLGSFTPLQAKGLIEESESWAGSVWMLEHINLNDDGCFEYQLGAAKLFVDLKPASAGFGALSMSCDEENLLEQPVIKQCLAVDQHIVVRAGSFDLTLEQIAGLRRGELITLTGCEFPMVRLMSGNVEIGRAEMVECDGKPAVQIVDVYQRTSIA